MEAEDIEAAVVKLSELLGLEATESQYQHLFETRPIILSILGYDRSLARPRLPLADGGYLEPDFLAETPRALWEVVDLKLPTERLLLGRDRRERLTARMHDYIAQVHEYDEYFDDAARRAAVLERFGADVQRRPGKVLIVGRDENTDKREIHHQMSRLASRVDILTYDDVLLALSQAYARVSGDTSRGQGFSAYLQLAVDNPAERRRGYIFDFTGSRGNRLSLYLDERRKLVLDLTTTAGEQHSIPAALPPHNSSSPILVNVEVGSNDIVAFVQMRIENALVAQLRLPRRDLQPSLAFSRATVGNTVDYSAGGWFGLFEWVLYTEVPQFVDRINLVRYFFEKRSDLTSFVSFNGHQGMDMQNLSEADP